MVARQYGMKQTSQVSFVHIVGIRSFTHTQRERERERARAHPSAWSATSIVINQLKATSDHAAPTGATTTWATPMLSFDAKANRAIPELCNTCAKLSSCHTAIVPVVRACVRACTERTNNATTDW